MKQRRSVWTWLARKANLQTRLTRDEWLAAYRIGAASVMPRPIGTELAQYRESLNEQASGAYARLLDKPPSATYEPPDKHTGPIKPVASREQLRRFLDTQSLPAAPGDMARSWHKKHKGKDSA